MSVPPPEVVGNSSLITLPSNDTGAGSAAADESPKNNNNEIAADFKDDSITSFLLGSTSIQAPKERLKILSEGARSSRLAYFGTLIPCLRNSESVNSIASSGVSASVCMYS